MAVCGEVLGRCVLNGGREEKSLERCRQCECVGWQTRARDSDYRFPYL